jgi:hypothetical protein
MMGDSWLVCFSSKTLQNPFQLGESAIIVAPVDKLAENVRTNAADHFAKWFSITSNHFCHSFRSRSP